MDLSLSLSVYEKAVLYSYIYILYTRILHTMFLLHYIFVHLHVHTHNIYIYMYINYIYVNMYYSSVDYAEWTFQLCMVMVILGAFITHQSCCIYDLFKFKSFLSTDSISLYGHIPTGSNLCWSTCFTQLQCGNLPLTTPSGSVLLVNLSSCWVRVCDRIQTPIELHWFLKWGAPKPLVSRLKTVNFGCHPSFRKPSNH